eukprot:15431429-Alexandrium_andersonii.AAC.1
MAWWRYLHIAIITIIISRAEPKFVAVPEFLLSQNYGVRNARVHVGRLPMGDVVLPVPAFQNSRDR